MRKKDEEKKKPENDKKKIKKLKMCINKKLKNFNCKKKICVLLIRFSCCCCIWVSGFGHFSGNNFTGGLVGSSFFLFYFSTNYVNCSKLSLFLNDSMFM